MTRLLLTRHGDDDLVAYGPEGTRTKRQFLADMARVAAVLPAPKSGSRVLLVVQEDRYYCAVAILGALSRGHVALLPPNNQRDTVMGLIKHPDTVTILHDTSVGAPIRLDHLLTDTSKSDYKPEPDSTFPSSPPIVRVPSKGSVAFHAEALDGTLNDNSLGQAPPPIAQRSLDSLLEEAELLTNALELDQDGPVAATCATTNAYGLVLSVLAPMLHGAAFLRTMHPSPDALVHAVRELNASRTAQFRATSGYLVSTPRHLNALAAAKATPPFAKALCCPPHLTQQQLEAVASHCRHPVTEIVADQAIAALGQRAGTDQQNADIRFRNVSGMSVVTETDDKYATVVAPYLNAGAPARSDVVTQVPVGSESKSTTSFHFLGNRDRLIFQDSLTLSLDDVECKLREHPAVADAAAVTAPDRSNSKHRILVAVDADPSQRAPIELVLAELVAPFAMNCELLCVRSLPIAANGNCPRADVLRLFGLGKQGLPPNYELNWTELPGEESDDSGATESRLARFVVHVPADCAYFEGHFPGYPLLPAAAQLTAIVLPAIQRARPDLGGVRRLVRLKFLGRIRRADDVTVELRFKPDTAIIDFSLSRKGNVCSIGRVELQPQNLF